jgi:chromosome segregation ATPase
MSEPMIDPPAPLLADPWEEVRRFEAYVMVDDDRVVFKVCDIGKWLLRHEVEAARAATQAQHQQQIAELREALAEERDTFQSFTVHHAATELAWEATKIDREQLQQQIAAQEAEIARLQQERDDLRIHASDLELTTTAQTVSQLASELITVNRQRLAAEAERDQLRAQLAGKDITEWLSGRNKRA